MLSKLRCLHRDGVVLTENDLADQLTHTGNLVVVDWTEGNVFKRAIRCARLLTSTIALRSTSCPQCLSQC